MVTLEVRRVIRNKEKNINSLYRKLFWLDGVQKKHTRQSRDRKQTGGCRKERSCRE